MCIAASIWTLFRRLSSLRRPPKPLTKARINQLSTCLLTWLAHGYLTYLRVEAGFTCTPARLLPVFSTICAMAPGRKSRVLQRCARVRCVLLLKCTSWFRMSLCSPRAKDIVKSYCVGAAKPRDMRGARQSFAVIDTHWVCIFSHFGRNVFMPL